MSISSFSNRQDDIVLISLIYIWSYTKHRADYTNWVEQWWDEISVKSTKLIKYKVKPQHLDLQLPLNVGKLTKYQVASSERARFNLRYILNDSLWQNLIFKFILLSMPHLLPPQGVKVSQRVCVMWTNSLIVYCWCFCFAVSLTDLRTHTHTQTDARSLNYIFTYLKFTYLSLPTYHRNSKSYGLPGTVVYWSCVTNVPRLVIIKSWHTAWVCMGIYQCNGAGF